MKKLIKKLLSFFGIVKTEIEHVADVATEITGAILKVIDNPTADAIILAITPKIAAYLPNIRYILKASLNILTGSDKSRLEDAAKAFVEMLNNKTTAAKHAFIFKLASVIFRLIRNNVDSETAADKAVISSILRSR